MSRQKLHSPHSVRRQASQRLQRTRLRRSTDMDEGGFTGRGVTTVLARRGRPIGGGGGGGWYHEGYTGYMERVVTFNMEIYATHLISFVL